MSRSSENMCICPSFHSMKKNRASHTLVNPFFHVMTFWLDFPPYYYLIMLRSSILFMKNGVLVVQTIIAVSHKLINLLIHQLHDKLH